MGDDGLGYTVSIPSIFIREDDAELIEQYLKTSTVIMLISFDVNKEEKVLYNFWIDLPDPEALVLINDFYEYKPKLEDKAKFVPYYQFFNSNNSPSQEGAISIDNCLGGGKYCCPDPDGPLAGNGRFVAYE